MGSRSGSLRQAGFGEGDHHRHGRDPVILSWATVHTVYTLRYARLYYAAGGGIDFHEDRPPVRRLRVPRLHDRHDLSGLRHHDASRTIRRTVLYHAYTSYIFGTVVVAMTINVVASLLNR